MPLNDALITAITQTPKPPALSTFFWGGGRVFAVRAWSAMDLSQSLVNKAAAETEQFTDRAGLKHQQQWRESP
jgi:hypothetical protein